MNLGDIDDRTVKECLKTGGKLKEFTARCEQVLFEALDTLRARRAHHYPRAMHTASTDLIFPHGDNEIAIACGLKDKPRATFRSGHVRRQECKPHSRQRPHASVPARAGH